MPAFKYKAFDTTGKLRSGVLQADSARQARSHLRSDGLIPEIVEPVAPIISWHILSPRVSQQELSLLTQQLSVLLESGLTIESSLTALISQITNPFTKETLSAIKADVVSGMPLSEALGKFGNSFPGFYRALVKAGEMSGSLPKILFDLARYLESRQSTQQKVLLALLYPAIVGVVAFLIVAGLLIYVVPQVIQVFEHSRQELPFLTRSLIWFSNFTQSWWAWIFSSVAFSIFLFVNLMKRKEIRLRFDRALLRLPVIGGFIRGLNTVRFSSTLSILVSGGVPLLAALQSTSGVTKNLAFVEAIHKVIHRVQEGASLSRAIAEEKVFPSLLIYFVSNGESIGRLEVMLEKVSLLENQALERLTRVYLTVLEPVMILCMGLTVLAIVLAILMPIIDMNQLVR